MSETESTEVKKSTKAKRHRTISQLKVVEVGSFVAEDDKPYTIGCAEEVGALPMLKEVMENADREVFVCLHLSTKCRLISWEIVSVGSLDSSIVHPRELFKGAILANAAVVVLAHNHPSGDATPSRADIELTRRLIKAGEVLGIEVLDHVIFGDEVVSMREMSLF